MPKPPFDPTLYLVTGGQFPDAALLEVVAAALSGGVSMLQLRDKTRSDAALLPLARDVQALARRAGVPLIVNDRVALALELDADGVHVGQDDREAESVRALLGPDKLVGVSVGTVLEARQAERAGADYLGAGDTFGTASKADAGEPIGLAGLRDICRAVACPVVSIGGVTAENAPDARAAGAAGVAVISAILNRNDPHAAARTLRSRLEYAPKERPHAPEQPRRR